MISPLYHYKHHHSHKISAMYSSYSAHHDRCLGRTGLMSFMQFDHGSIVRTSTGRDEPRMIRFVFGIRSSCREWQSVFRMPSPTPRSRCSSTNVLTAFTYRMTGWQVFWLRMRILRSSQSRGTSTLSAWPLAGRHRSFLIDPSFSRKSPEDEVELRRWKSAKCAMGRNRGDSAAPG